ncbi:MAG TPA: VOC family protein, partial [Nitrosospira sp.]|nr:VOC family protein [Nitrosospira sp.]
AAFVSAGGYHHHIGLNTWESKGGSPPAPGTTGLFHTAIVYPTRAALAEALRRVREAGIHLDAASDHGISEALYLRDPDQNGVELYWDRQRRNGRVMQTADLPCSRASLISTISFVIGKFKRYEVIWPLGRHLRGSPRSKATSPSAIRHLTTADFARMLLFRIKVHLQGN